MSARTYDEKIARVWCGYSPGQKIIGMHSSFSPGIGYLTIYGHRRARAALPIGSLRLYRRRANYWKRFITARTHFSFPRALKASACRSAEVRPVAGPCFVVVQG